MNTFKKFRCAECGGTVDLAPPNGRTIEYMRGYPVRIPDEFPIPTCTNCRKIYIPPEIEEQLYPILEKQSLQLQAEHYLEIVQNLVSKYKISEKDIAIYCGISLGDFLNFKNGNKMAPLMLTRLLTLLSNQNISLMK